MENFQEDENDFKIKFKMILQLLLGIICFVAVLVLISEVPDNVTIEFVKFITTKTIAGVVICATIYCIKKLN